MGPTRPVLLITCLLLGAAALCGVLDADAVPFIGIALFVLALTAWRRRRARLDAIRRAALRLRPFTAEERDAAVDAVTSDELRGQIAAAVARQGTETRDGAVERFPLPAVWQPRAARKFWTAWALSAAVMSVAAFDGDSAPRWRAAWLILACLLALRARRTSHLSALVQLQIEITPFRLSLLGPTGSAQTLFFADGIRLDDQPAHAVLIVRSGERAIPISYHLIGVRRLIRLVRTYGNVPSETSSRAS